MRSSVEPAFFVLAVVFTEACKWKCRADCQYPKYLQSSTESSSWLIHERTEGKFVQVTVKSNRTVVNKCTTSNETGAICVNELPDMTCEKRFTKDRYLVKETDDQETIYRCIQFLRRSDAVVETKSSMFLREMNEGLCPDEDDMLSSDNPMVSKKSGGVAACPVPGAYDFDMTFETDSYASNVSTDTPQSRSLRFESDCMPTRGIRIYFEEKDSLSKFPGMEGKASPIVLSCLATWKEEGTVFSVAKTENDPYNFWCLRIRQRDGVISELSLFRNVCTRQTNTSIHNPKRIVFKNIRESNMSCPTFSDPASYTPSNKSSELNLCFLTVVWVMSLVIQ